MNRFSKYILMVSLLSGVWACEQKKPLHIALHSWVGYQFVLLAEKEGLLPEKQIRLLKTSILSESARALAEGRVDGAALTLDEVLRLRDQGLNLSVVLVFNVSAGADALLAGPGIERLSEIKGKRLGVEASTLGAVMLAETLKAAGLAQSDVIVTPMDDNHYEAWKQGNMDGVFTYEPYLSMLENREGLRRIFDSRSIPQVILDVLAVRTDAAKKHPDALRQLVAGHFKALNQWRTNPIDTAYRLAPGLGVPPDRVRDSFKGLELPDTVYNRKYLTPPAKEMTRSAGEITDILRREGVLTGSFDVEGLFVPSYLPEAPP